MDLSALINNENIDAVRRQFTTELDCEKHLHQLRWESEVTSPFDAASKVYNCRGGRYRCKNSKKYFNVRTNTLFHNSKVPLPIWFEAIWIIAHSNKITSVALAAELSLTQKTAWYMLRRIKRFLSDNKIKPTVTALPTIPDRVDSLPNADRLNMTDWLKLLKSKQ